MIRKQNSEFTTAFTSEANKNLKNTDCFAHVELDGYACYVTADGIDDKMGAKSARLCVDSVISAFTESPSMSKKSLKKYIRIANKTLLENKSKKKLKASVTIIVHNYVKMRYAQAGNVRLRLYRNGFLKVESRDQSLSMDLVLDNKLSKDKLEKHEERHNLYTYVGQRKDFSPFISKKIKLMESDAIAIYTRGFWENIDDGEVLDIFKDASNDPHETVKTAEDMLLSKQVESLEAFTFATIFVSKTYIDPNKKRRIKKIMMITIPIVIILVVLGIILLVMYNKKQDNIKLMNENFLTTIEYITADNYIRAKKSCDKALELAEKVKDDEMKDDSSNYLMLIESIIKGDENLADSKYEVAQNDYLNALDRSRYADKLSEDYIKNNLKLTANYMSVYDLIVLGDTLALNLQYDEAEEKYLSAKVLSSKIYFDDGRKNAMSALEDLYVDKKELKETTLEESNQTVEMESSAANFVAQGDKSYIEVDFHSALVFYTSAQQKYNDLGDNINSAMLDDKISSTNKKIELDNEKCEEADGYIEKAEESFDKNEYVDSIKYYLLAKDVYARVKDDEKILEIDRRIDMIDIEIGEQDKEIAEAEDEKDE